MNHERRLYGNAEEIEKQLAHMQLMEEAAGGWAAVYKHTHTGKYWMRCLATAGVQGGGYEMLIRLPLPRTDELVEIAINSAFEDEAVAAVMRLLDEEALEHKDFRHLLVERLQAMELEKAAQEQKQRIRQIITLTSLVDPINKKEVTGKTLEQLKADALHFEAVSKEALKLLDKLK